MIEGLLLLDSLLLGLGLLVALAFLARARKQDRERRSEQDDLAAEIEAVIAVLERMAVALERK